MRRRLIGIAFLFLVLLGTAFLLRGRTDTEWPTLFEGAIHQGTVFHLAFSTDGEVLASTDDHNSLRVVRLATGEISDLCTERFPFSQIAFSPRGDVLLAGNEKPILTICHLQSRKVETLPLELCVECLAFIPQESGRAILGGTLTKANRNAGRLAVWEMGKPGLRTIFETDASPRTLAYGPLTIAVGFSDGSIRIFDLKTMTEQQSFRRSHKAILRLAFRPDGSELATLALMDDRIDLWDVRSGALVRSVKNGVSMYSFCLSADGSLLVTSDSSSSVKVWDLSTTKLLSETRSRSSVHKVMPAFLNKKATAPAYCLSVSRDGSKLAGGLVDGTVVVWDFMRATKTSHK